MQMTKTNFLRNRWSYINIKQLPTLPLLQAFDSAYFTFKEKQVRSFYDVIYHFVNAFTRCYYTGWLVSVKLSLRKGT